MLERRIDEEAFFIDARRRLALDLDTAIRVSLLLEIISAAIVSNCRVIWNFLTSDNGVDNPFETFLALNHFNKDLSLDNLMVLLDVELEFLVASANVCDDIVCLHFHVDFVDAHEIERSLDPNDWYGDAHLIDHPFELKVDIHASSWHEAHRSFLEKCLALLLNLTLGHTSKVDFADNIVLVTGVLL